jgi:hypothetical protein
MADQTPPSITDPQSHDAYGSASPNDNAVDNAPVAGDAQTDNPRILPRQIPSGVSRGIQQLGGDSLEADSGNKRITVTDNGTKQVLMGSQATFGEGFYVTKAGKDVTLTTNPTDFIFNSNQNVFKIVASTSLRYTVSGQVQGSVYSPTYLHNLGYEPAFLVYLSGSPVSGAGNYVQLPFGTTSWSAGTPTQILWSSFITAGTNTTTLTIEMFFAGTAGLFDGVYNFKIFLLQETAN